jgi:pimeloyl-ACP methyl ester carboxylesterase
MWPELHHYFHLIAFDFLGFGYSSKPYPYQYSISEQADITDHILSEMGIVDCHVIAHDYAVSAAQELLYRRLSDPQLPTINKLILLNGGLFPETHQARPIQKLLLGPLGKWVNKLLNKCSLRKNLIQVFGPDTPPSDQEIDAFWEIINYNDGKRCFSKTIHYMTDRINNRENWLKALRETSTPILLVNGPEDPVSGQHLVDRYKELIPNPNCVVLEGIGHYPNVEAPEQVNIEVLKFFHEG